MVVGTVLATVSLFLNLWVEVYISTAVICPAPLVYTLKTALMTTHDDYTNMKEAFGCWEYYYTGPCGGMQ
jgi:hypothetical protein